MEEDLKKLDELFDSIIEEIIHPEKAGTFVNPFVEEKVRSIAGLAESICLVTIKVSSDNMSAVCTVSSSGEQHKPFSADEIMRAASSAGVFCGIDEDAVNEMAEKQIINTPVTIAKGTPAVPGTDGRIKLKVNVGTAEAPSAVEKDTEVCHVLMPTPGRDGMDVRGHVLTAKAGTGTDIMIGEGLYKRGNRFYAETEGNFIVRDGKYCIVNEKIIDKNVDQSMGVVGFSGTIIINGNVSGRGVIRAGGSVIIHGNVSEAIVEAEKNIMIDGSSYESSISASTGDIKGKEFTDCTLVAGEKISAEAIRGCTVKSVYGIDCLSGMGIITGGEIYCAGNISCILVGGREHAETRIVMGNHEEFSGELEKLSRKVTAIDGDMAKITAQVNEIHEREKDGTASLEDKSFLDAALRIRTQKAAEKVPLTERIKKLNDIIRLAEKATLSAKTMIYGGTILSIGGFTQIINADRPHATLKSNGSAIVMI